MTGGFGEGQPKRLDTSHSPGSRGSKVKVGPAGRVVIPAEMRAALDIKEGDVLLAHLAGDELKLVTLDAAIRRTQAAIRQSVPEGTGLVDAFLAERRAVWAKDE